MSNHDCPHFTVVMRLMRINLSVDKVYRLCKTFLRAHHGRNIGIGMVSNKRKVASFDRKIGIFTLKDTLDPKSVTQ